MGKLLRSADKKLAGVCGGIAENFGWEVRNVRLVWFLLTLVSAGSMVLFYLILCFLMPDSAKVRKSYEERMKERLGK